MFSCFMSASMSAASRFLGMVGLSAPPTACLTASGLGVRSVDLYYSTPGGESHTGSARAGRAAGGEGGTFGAPWYAFPQPPTSFRGRGQTPIRTAHDPSSWFLGVGKLSCQLPVPVSLGCRGRGRRESRRTTHGTAAPAYRGVDVCCSPPSPRGASPSRLLRVVRPEPGCGGPGGCGQTPAISPYSASALFLPPKRRVTMRQADDNSGTLNKAARATNASPPTARGATTATSLDRPPSVPI